VWVTGLPTGININVCIGFIAFFPMVCHLSRFSPNVPVDKMLGLLSFPLFLCHEAAGYGIRWFHFSSAPAKLVLALCAAAMLVLCVEIPVDRFRYSVRQLFKRTAATRRATADAPVQ